MTTYTANKLNQYTSVSGTTPVHDEDGNVTDYKNMKYSWNAENQMISAEPKNSAEGDKKTEYLYDYMGRRARKLIYVYSSGGWNQTTEKLFVYDGWNLIKEITKTGATSSDKFYVWGLDLSQSLQGAGGIGGLVCAVHAGEVRHFFYDANGNVGQVVNDDGSIAAHYEYDPFGNIVNGVSPADSNPFRFSTKYYDAETGLYYYGFRDYSAELGRWWSRDPAEEGGGENVYSFVRNNGINYSDYIGMWYIDTDAWVSGKRHIWIAEAGDKLADLATKHYGASKDDRYCIWPVGEWDAGYPEKVMPCGRYDASNLNPNPDPSEKVIFGVTLELQFLNDDQAMFGFPFILSKGGHIAGTIKEKSEEGKTPISMLIVSGHSGPSGTMSGRMISRGGRSSEVFRTDELTDLNQPPSFSRAKDKKGPVRCWFGRTATVIFSGCSSMTIAQSFANEILRKGAHAWGTNQTICSGSDGKLGWNWNRSVSRCMTRAEWQTAPIWTIYGGSL